MAIKCYGWIPILTSKLLVAKDPPYKFLKNPSDSEEQEIEGIFAHDENKLITGITISIPEKGTLKVKCGISNTGLVEYSFDEIALSSNPVKNKINNERMLPIFILDVIRDVYHDHVHHDKKADCKLKPVLAENKEEAVEKILAQYEHKIIAYHKDSKFIKNYFNIPKTNYLKYKRWRDFLTTGSGELIYAKSFIYLHKDLLERSGYNIDNINKSFNHSIESIGVLKDKVSWSTSYAISLFALIIAMIALISIVEPTYTLLHNFILQFNTPFC